MEYRGRMDAYKIDSIPALPDKTVSVVTRQIEDNIIGMINITYIYIYI